MKPYYQDSAVTIYHGDCREILPKLDNFDCVLTDPPYGIGEKMKGGTWGSAEKYSDFRKWDIAPTNEFFHSLIKGKNCIIWGGNYFYLPRSRCWLIWDKTNSVPTMADCELAWTSFDRPAKKFSCCVGIHTLGHPTQKPIELITWSLGFFKDPKIILDPFMGSGTTLRAAKDLGKRAIGVEISEKYCEIAAQRMCQEVLDL